MNDMDEDAPIEEAEPVNKLLTNSESNPLHVHRMIANDFGSESLSDALIHFYKCALHMYMCV